MAKSKQGNSAELLEQMKQQKEREGTLLKRLPLDLRAQGKEFTKIWEKKHGKPKPLPTANRSH